MENIRIGNLEIMSNDLPNKMAWTAIPEAIESIGGNEWRLPTEAEFAMLYRLYVTGTGNFKPKRYWSASARLLKAWYYDLGVGYSPHVADQTNEYYVRLVRTI